MTIVTKSGEAIIFNRLEDLREHIDDNILEVIKEYIESKINKVSEMVCDELEWEGLDFDLNRTDYEVDKMIRYL